jgi:hypothetical protein
MKWIIEFFVKYVEKRMNVKIIEEEPVEEVQDKPISNINVEQIDEYEEESEEESDEDIEGGEYD